MALQISDTTPRIQYTATSGQSSFSVPFEFFDVADLKVYNGTTLLTYSTSPASASQYSVTGAGVTGGGSITLGGSGATLNDKITIVRDLAIERISDFPVSGNFPIQTLNTELDKIVAMLQQLEEQFARTLQYPVTTTTGFNVDLPELVANRVLSVNADATALLANQELGTFQGDWAASTSYKIRDLVKDTSNGNIYFVNTAHTSSGTQPLSSNANSSYYDLIVDAASATTSATNAASSATAASTSATAAANSATAAASSETNAATSESNASTSESNASTSASAAASSASAAATSATNAATSESNASTSETNAATSATNAASSATSAAGSATTATTKASEASTSATNAATSETNAATSASNASTSETNAATSATNASNAQTAAETAQAAAEAIADNIDDTYLGAKASNPTVDNDGDPLTVGDWYFNTTSNQTFIYNGSSWDAIAPDLIGDTTPQLGGDLDLNSNDITGTGNINITGTATVSGDLTVDTSTLHVDSGNNRVGIGTTSPDTLLDASQNNATQFSSGGDQRSINVLTLRNANETQYTFAGISLYAGAGTGADWTIANVRQANYEGDLVFKTRTGASGWSEKIRVKSSGNVGIGTSSPSTKLTLDIGTDNVGLFQNSTDATSGISLADNGGSINLATTSSGAFRVLVGGDANTSADNSSEAMRIDSSGNVGIGTSSPTAQLTVIEDVSRSALTGTGVGQIHISGGATPADNDVSSITFSTNNTTTASSIIGNQLTNNGSNLFFGTTGNYGAGVNNTAMFINYAGNVGIGTTSPEYKFHVEVNDSGGFAGTLRNTNVNGYILELDYPSNSPDNNTVAFLVARDSTSNRFIVFSDGDVVNHDNSYGSISDEKLKEQITDASSQWNDIKDLRIRKFKFKSDVSEKGDSDELWRLGLVAQEAELVSPNLIKESPDLDDNNQDLGTTTKSVKYSILYMKAVKALQEAMQKIEDLEARVDTLEGN